MWNATILDKYIEQGILHVNVSYINGENRFNEIYDLRTGDELNLQITMRLAQLEKLEVFSDALSLGAYTPEEISDGSDPKADALAKVKELKQLVDLGVIDSTDKKFTDAIETVKIELNKDGING